METKRTISMGIGVVFFLCAFMVILALSCTSVRIASFESNAQRLGIEPTMYGVAQQIEETIEIGMTRDEVEQRLKAIAPIVDIKRGPLELVPGVEEMTYIDSISIRFTPLPGVPSYALHLLAYYDSEGKLTFLGSTDLDTMVEIDE